MCSEQYFFLLHVNSEMVSVTVTDIGPTKNTDIWFHDENAMSSIIPLSPTGSQFSLHKDGD